MSARTIMITSCKGGVGKSTITANLGYSLAALGYRTLVIDCDFGIRSLDIILGVEDNVVYDICDVVMRGIELKKALIRDRRSEKLDFCAAPTGIGDKIEPKQFRATINSAAEDYGYDYILLDTPGDIGDAFNMAASASDTALIVSTIQPASVRAAERTGMLATGVGVTNLRLIINCFDFYVNPDNEQSTVLDIIDRTYLRLIGIIPYDNRLSKMQSRGALIDELKNTNTAASFANIALRITGKNIPLFTSFRDINRKSLMNYIRSTGSE